MPSRRKLLLLVFVGGLGVCSAIYSAATQQRRSGRSQTSDVSRQATTLVGISDDSNGSTTQTGIPEYRILWGASQHATSDEYSNIQSEDYVGAAKCAQCHVKQFQQWSDHPHRWMNAKASRQTVRGDFDSVTMVYRSGVARFYHRDDEYYMELSGRTNRVYVVEQTIGSRHLQFYVGKQVSGPEPVGGMNYSVSHVLPLGYELAKNRWIPATNVGWNLGRFGDVVDPFLFNRTPAYHPRCITCHTTIAWGDLALKTSVNGDFPPRLKSLAKLAGMSWHGSQYLRDAHPHRFETPDGIYDQQPKSDEAAFIRQMQNLEARDLSVALGISCEACHLGGKAHAADPAIPMRFAPSAPSVHYHGKDQHQASQRNGSNINLLCARCHHNTAKTYSGGMATYNSVEFTDATAGSCYSQLNCVHCHDPHQATGAAWSLPREKEDALCTACHSQFTSTEVRAAHTHHAPDSEASRCMNCHMPRITEGINGMVRTHTIFSPNHEAMLKSNQPNACNLCHLEKSKAWTIGHLSEWYGRPTATDLADGEDAAKPSGTVWLESDHIWTRMSAAHAACRQDARWLLPPLLDLLQDDYIVGRHFLELDLERMLGVSLDEHGYQFYQSKQQREVSVGRLRRQLEQWTKNDR